MLAGTSLSSRSPEPSCATASSSTLAAALLDSHQHRFGYRNSNAAGQDNRVRGACILTNYTSEKYL
jgi:hypothetical protein